LPNPTLELINILTKNHAAYIEKKIESGCRNVMEIVTKCLYATLGHLALGIQPRLVAEWIRRQPCNRKIVDLIPVYGRFATPFSKEFNLAMLTTVHAST